MKKLALYPLLIAATLLVEVCLGVSGPTSTAASGNTATGKDIADTVAANGNFNTLAAALQTAGLMDTLREKDLSQSLLRQMRHLQKYQWTS